jgi:lactate dehydrogenase-like 2-hydroxyacid dehydrogenase
MKNRFNKPAKNWIKCAIWSLIYVLFIAWVGNYWWLLLLPFIVDIFVTRFIPWDFWKKTKNKVLYTIFSWIDAIVFALVAVYFINLYLFQNYQIPTSSLEKSPYNIDEAKVLVTGYGYCGKAIAKRLGALGARVTVLARRKEARKEAKGDGFYAVDFAFGPEEAMGAAMVVNTVPALVVTEKIIRELPRDAYIVDIASGEGGTDFACAREYGIHADHVLGIPGKYAPKESAYILERSVERFILKEKQGEMSDGF